MGCRASSRVRIPPFPPTMQVNKGPSRPLLLVPHNFPHTLSKWRGGCSEFVDFVPQLRSCHGQIVARCDIAPLAQGALGQEKPGHQAEPAVCLHFTTCARPTTEYKKPLCINLQSGFSHLCSCSHRVATSTEFLVSTVSIAAPKNPR